MLSSILRIIALTRKELLAVLKDRRARMSLLIPPIVQGLVFGYAATYDLNHVPYAVLDQNRSVASRQLLAGLDGSGVFQRVADLRSTADVMSVIDRRRALLVVQIDQDFERRLAAGQGAVVQVIADGRNSNTSATAMSYVNAVVAAFNARWRQDHSLPGPTVQVTNRAWYNPNLETRWNMLPGMIGTLTLIQTMMLTAMSVAREREQGTFDQLLVTPFRPFEIMAGKALPSMLVGLVQATGVLLVAQLWFRIPFAGSLFTLYTGLLFFGRDHAAGDALFPAADHALLVAFGTHDSLDQHAERSPVLHRHQSVAVRDRHRTAGLPGRSRPECAHSGSVASRTDRCDHTYRRLVDVHP
jgi:ABC-2 type transport system permease protein